MTGEDRRFTFGFESFGVRVGITADENSILEEIRGRIVALFPAELIRFVPHRGAQYRFSVRRTKKDRYVMFFGRIRVTGGNDRDVFLRFLESRIRLIVAERAKERVFVHAGVVEWCGRAILIPARSYSGKTTLVKELTKLGAKYYSDEYAVLDDRGVVYPFTKTLSVRNDSKDGVQEEVQVEALGGQKGTEPIPVGLVVLTEFERGSMFEPKALTVGSGILELLSHTIPASYRPEFSLKVLNNTVSHAIIVKSKRGEAKDFAVKLLSFFEEQMR